MEVHVVVPDGIDDTELPSGGNVYDRRVCGGLAELGSGAGEPGGGGGLLRRGGDGGAVMPERHELLQAGGIRTWETATGSLST